MELARESSRCHMESGYIKMNRSSSKQRSHRHVLVCSMLIFSFALDSTGSCPPRISATQQERTCGSDRWMKPIPPSPVCTQATHQTEAGQRADTHCKFREVPYCNASCLNSTKAHSSHVLGIPHGDNWASFFSARKQEYPRPPTV